MKDGRNSKSTNGVDGWALNTPQYASPIDPRLDVQIAMDLLDEIQATRETEAELSAETYALLNEICADIDDAAMAFSIDSDFALLAAMNPSDFQ